MGQNTFKFNNKFYSQTDGTAMGNSLSPFLANLFMSFFETSLKEDLPNFPDFWKRYVDDILAILDSEKCDLHEFLDVINKRFPTIKFTVEEEKDNSLPFLDLLIIRNGENIEFDIYRKSTNTNQFIPASSNHHESHKMSALYSGVHRLVSIPLTNQRFQKEKNFLKSIAVTHGYDPSCIEVFIKKKLKKMRAFNVNDYTKLEPITEHKNRVIIPFNKQLCKGLDRILKSEGLLVTYKSSNNLRKSLGSPKEAIENNLKSGIYNFKCNNCDFSYIGQTRRSILTRAKDHLRCFKTRKKEISGIADHMFEFEDDHLNGRHLFPLQNLKLLKEVPNPFFLDAWECLYINKFKNRNLPLLNRDNGKICSKMFDLI